MAEDNKIESRFVGADLASGLQEEREDDENMAVRLDIPVSSQRPVSLLGWTLALVLGAALWAVIYLMLA